MVAEQKCQGSKHTHTHRHTLTPIHRMSASLINTDTYTQTGNTITIKCTGINTNTHMQTHITTTTHKHTPMQATHKKIPS
jgi:hypothetical protein